MGGGGGVLDLLKINDTLVGCGLSVLFLYFVSYCFF